MFDKNPAQNSPDFPHIPKYHQGGEPRSFGVDCTISGLGLVQISRWRSISTNETICKPGGFVVNRFNHPIYRLESDVENLPEGIRCLLLGQ